MVCRLPGIQLQASGPSHPRFCLALHRNEILIHPRNKCLRHGVLPVLQYLDRCHASMPPITSGSRSHMRAPGASEVLTQGCLSNLPTEAGRLSRTPNLSATKLVTIWRVHKSKSKPYWRGSLPLTHRNTCCSCLTVSFRGRPVPFVERRASNRALLALLCSATCRLVQRSRMMRLRRLDLSLEHPLNGHPPDLFQRFVIQRSSVANHQLIVYRADTNRNTTVVSITDQ